MIRRRPAPEWQRVGPAADFGPTQQPRRRVPGLPLTIPRPPESAACDRQSRFRRRTPWRPGQEEREVGRSFASGRVCKKNKVYSHSAAKSSEKENRTGSITDLRMTNFEVCQLMDRCFAALLLPRQPHHAFNMECLGKKINHVDFFHVITGFKKQAGITRKGCGI